MGLLTKIFGGGDGSAPSTERSAKEGAPNGAGHARPALPVERKSGPVPRALEPALSGYPGAGVDSPRRRPLIGAGANPPDIATLTGRPSSMTLPLGLSLDATARLDSAPPPRPSELIEILPPRMESDIVALADAAPAWREAPAEPEASAPEEDFAEDDADRVSRPLELLVDLSFRLALGPVSEEWLSEGAAAAQALKVVAREGWQPHLLASFESLERLLGEGARIRALPVLWRLSDSVPEWPAPARGLREGARARERRIVAELLAGVDGLRARVRQQFAQEKTLAHLCGSTAELLASELQTPIERAEELARRVARYEAERHASPIDIGHEAALHQAVLELDRWQRQFEASDESGRAVRQERRDALQRVNLLLAERGDLALLDELEPLAVGERIERLSALIGLGVGERA